MVQYLNPETAETPPILDPEFAKKNDRCLDPDIIEMVRFLDPEIVEMVNKSFMVLWI